MGDAGDAGDMSSPSESASPALHLPIRNRDSKVPVRLFNDVHFCAGFGDNTSWPPFSHLPTELRLHIWQLFVEQHRLIEVEISTPFYTNNPEQPPRNYTDCNHLGNVVSGRGYHLEIRGPGGYATALSPLLWVNHEARQIALNFYRVRLPFPGNGAHRELYLNPEYDVLYVRPGYLHAALLPDLLHDVRAYDPKDQGISHLALQHDALDRHAYNPGPLADHTTPSLTPADLHPAAAASFTDILTNRLRSVLCITAFQSPLRAIGSLPSPSTSSTPFSHFAHTFPLFRRGAPAGSFSWLASDPRTGVEADLLHLPLSPAPRDVLRTWERLADEFGLSVGGPSGDDDEEEAQQEEEERPVVGARFYICPTLDWHRHVHLLGRGQAARPEEGSRGELVLHLRAEAEQWEAQRERLGGAVPKHGSTVVDAEAFAVMERGPGTAMGVWVFPGEVFGGGREREGRGSVFDLSGVRPGLLLFDV